MLSVDEKSQIQALDRTQLGLPLKRGRGVTMTHDYKRNGTTTLFAAECGSSPPMPPPLADDDLLRYVGGTAKGAAGATPSGRSSVGW